MTDKVWFITGTSRGFGRVWAEVAEDPPLRFFWGSAGLLTTRAEYAKRLDTWEKWNEVSVQAQGARPPRQARH